MSPQNERFMSELMSKGTSEKDAAPSRSVKLGRFFAFSSAEASSPLPSSANVCWRAPISPGWRHGWIA